MTTAELSLGEFLQASLDRKPTPAMLGIAWRERVLRWAQNHLIDTICFGKDPAGHAHCQAYFESLPEDERESRFFCLGMANVCHNQVKVRADAATGEIVYVDCGHQWYGNYEARCPHCGGEYLPDTLQRLRWYEALITLVAQEAQDFRSFAGTITVDLVFRIAEFLRKSGVVTLPEALGAKDYERIAAALRHKLLEMGHPASSDVYDATNWAARVPAVMPWLGIEPGRYESWTRNMQRQFVPVLAPALEGYLDDKPGPVEAVCALLDQEKPWPEIVADILALLAHRDDLDEEAAEEDEETGGFGGYVLRQGKDPGFVVVVIPLDANDLPKFEMQANLELTDRGVTPRQWNYIRALALETDEEDTHADDA